jgi:hypothetical protein
MFNSNGGTFIVADLRKAKPKQPTHLLTTHLALLPTFSQSGKNDWL